MGLETGLRGKTALITGASRGIGRATAAALAAQGCNVVLSSRKQEALEEVAAEIRAAHPGVGVLPKAAHVGDEEAARACVEAAVGEFGAVDVLVNNAATSPHFGPMVDLDAGRAAKTVQVNQFAVVLWTQLAWRLSMAERGGSIVNIASVGGMAHRARHRLLQRDEGRRHPPHPAVRDGAGPGRTRQRRRPRPGQDASGPSAVGGERGGDREVHATRPDR